MYFTLENKNKNLRNNCYAFLCKPKEKKWDMEYIGCFHKENLLIF